MKTDARQVDQHVDWWVWAAESFLGCLYQTFDPRANQPPDADYFLDARHFPAANHWVVCQVLMAHQECSVTPREDTMRSLGKKWGYVFETNNMAYAYDPPYDIYGKVIGSCRADTIGLLPFFAASPAGMANFARLLIAHARKRELAELIERHYRLLFDRFVTAEDITDGLCLAIQKWR